MPYPHRIHGIDPGLLYLHLPSKNQPNVGKYTIVYGKLVGNYTMVPWILCHWEMYRSLVQGRPRIQLEAPFEMAENEWLTWGEMTLLIGYRAYDLIYNW